MKLIECLIDGWLIDSSKCSLFCHISRVEELQEFRLLSDWTGSQGGPSTPISSVILLNLRSAMTSSFTQQYCQNPVTLNTPPVTSVPGWERWAMFTGPNNYRTPWLHWGSGSVITLAGRRCLFSFWSPATACVDGLEVKLFDFLPSFSLREAGWSRFWTVCVGVKETVCVYVCVWEFV